MRNEGVAKPQHFHSGGQFVGVVGLLGVALFAGIGVVGDDTFPLWAWPTLGLVALLIWSVVVRPAVVLHLEAIELRNIFESRHVPYALITEVEVKQMTVVHTAEGKYLGAGFGRSRRMIRREGVGGGPGSADPLFGGMSDRIAGDSSDSGGGRAKGPTLARLLEHTVQQRAEQARALNDDQGGVRRVWSQVELAAAGVLVVALVIALLVG